MNSILSPNMKEEKSPKLWKGKLHQFNIVNDISSKYEENGSTWSDPNQADTGATQVERMESSHNFSTIKYNFRGLFPQWEKLHIDSLLPPTSQACLLESQCIFLDLSLEIQLAAFTSHSWGECDHLNSCQVQTSSTSFEDNIQSWGKYGNTETMHLSQNYPSPQCPHTLYFS